MNNFVYKCKRGASGALGIAFFATCCVGTGYMWRGMEDGAVVAQLIDRVRSARVDERVQCSILMQGVEGAHAAHDLMCATQVQTLIDQHRR